MTMKRMKTIRFLILPMLFFVTLSGCANPFTRYVYIHDRYPEYKVPQKSKIAKITSKDLVSLDTKTKKKIVSSVKNLKVESARLRTILESYNDYASRKNSEYDKLFKRPKK